LVSIIHAGAALEVLVTPGRALTGKSRFPAMSESITSQPELPFGKAEEEWRPVAGWTGYYEVSDLGRVRSLSRTMSDGRFLKGRILKPTRGKGGYYQVTLARDGSSDKRYVHHLVAEAFVGPRPKGLDVRHGSSNRLDNRAEQFCYGTRRENLLDKIRDGTMLRGEASPVAKLTDAAVADARQRCAPDGADEPISAVAREYGVCPAVMREAVIGVTWEHVPVPPVTFERSRSERTRMAKLSSAQAADILARSAAGEPASTLAREYEVSPKTIRRIVTGVTWKEIPGTRGARGKPGRPRREGPL
jgi:hypothetical protein